MQKKLKLLEKERKDAVTRAEKAEKLRDQSLEKEDAARKELDTTRKQKERMEGLCRSLTLERQRLKDQLGQADGDASKDSSTGDNGIEGGANGPEKENTAVEAS